YLRREARLLDGRVAPVGHDAPRRKPMEWPGVPEVSGSTHASQKTFPAMAERCKNTRLEKWSRSFFCASSLSGKTRVTPLTRRLPLKVPAPGAGFARATESSGEVRKGGDAPLRVS